MVLIEEPGAMRMSKERAPFSISRDRKYLPTRVEITRCRHAFDAPDRAGTITHDRVARRPTEKTLPVPQDWPHRRSAGPFSQPTPLLALPLPPRAPTALSRSHEEGWMVLIDEPGAMRMSKERAPFSISRDRKYLPTRVEITRCRHAFDDPDRAGTITTTGWLGDRPRKPFSFHRTGRTAGRRVHVPGLLTSWHASCDPGPYRRRGHAARSTHARCTFANVA